jgi:Xaa-Pro aminopeptidase
VTHDHRSRLDAAAAGTKRAGFSALVITPSPDLAYLVGYDAPVLERLTALVVRAKGDPVLVVPRLEQPRAQASPAGALAEVVSWKDGEDPNRLMRKLIKGKGKGRVGVTDRMWASQFLALQRALPQARFRFAARVMAPLRAVKDAGEVLLLRRAAHGADRTFTAVTSLGLLGKTESEVGRGLADGLLANDHESVGFTIVGSGPNGASPHHDTGRRTIRAGDAVVLDFGGRVGGYCSDVTRTVAVKAASARVAEVHAVVKEAQEAAFRASGPGVPAEEVDRAARSVIEAAGFGDAFIHRTGHGIGLEEHEDPYLVEGNDRPLVPGNCFSIEPGIYLDRRFGVRVEDIVTITETGCERLNRATRDLVVVG